MLVLCFHMFFSSLFVRWIPCIPYDREHELSDRNYAEIDDDLGSLENVGALTKSRYAL